MGKNIESYCGASGAAPGGGKVLAYVILVVAPPGWRTWQTQRTQNPFSCSHKTAGTAPPWLQVDALPAMVLYFFCALGALV